MSTRCLIGKENKDKTITYVYCHHEGYPDYVGKILVKNYTDETVIDKLLSLGDLSSLGTTPKPIIGFDIIDNNFCRPYSLRGEDCPATTVKNEEEYTKTDRWQEYIYLFRNSEWYSEEVDGWKLVKEII